ncbi:hypothetical protein INT45_011548 [Circinella minor]|uniref:Uncharacterized protein n=1 Tax=Circinella minor TaxID=1195481 RepID=A0A8H7S5G8_9FUNG|nr:hypothetical protein INT45_011548 [Circinella minor]
MPADGSKRGTKSSVPTTPYPTNKEKNQKASNATIITAAKTNTLPKRAVIGVGSEPPTIHQQQSTAPSAEITALTVLVEKLAKRIDQQDAEIQTRVQGQNNQIKALYDRQEEMIAQLKEVDHLKEQLAFANHHQQTLPQDQPILQHQPDLGDHMDEDLCSRSKKGAQKSTIKATTAISQPSAQAIAWAKRSFQKHNGPTGYSFVYLKSNHRTKHSEVRKKLRILKVEQARVIDIQFPCKGIIGLLVHASYAPELIELLEKVNLKIIRNFDSTSSDIINDPTLQDLDLPEKKKQATQIYQKRMLRMYLNIPKASLGLAILRHFAAQEGPHNISQHNVDIFLQRKPAPTSTKKIHQQTDADLFVIFQKNIDDVAHTNDSSDIDE